MRWLTATAVLLSFAGLFALALSGHEPREVALPALPNREVIAALTALPSRPCRTPTAGLVLPTPRVPSFDDGIVAPKPRIGSLDDGILARSGDGLDPFKSRVVPEIIACK